MSYTAGVILLVSAVGIVILALLQIVQYRRGRQIITRRQMILRLVMAIMLLGVIALIFIGAAQTWQDPVFELIFWTSLIIPAIAVIFLAMGDLREIERQRHLRRAQLYREMQKLQDTQQQRAETDRTGDDDHGDEDE